MLWWFNCGECIGWTYVILSLWSWGYSYWASRCKRWKIYTAPLHELSAAVGEDVNNLRALYIAPLKDGLSFNIKDYTKEFDENDETTEADLVDKLEKLVADLKENLNREEDYTSNNSKLLAEIINTSLDFTIASDNYYELSDILSEMKTDRQK